MIFIQLELFVFDYYSKEVRLESIKMQIKQTVAKNILGMKEQYNFAVVWSDQLNIATNSRTIRYKFNY